MQLKPHPGAEPTWRLRRQLLTGAAGLLAGLLIAGCATPPAPPPSPIPAPTVPPPVVPKRPPRIGLALGGGAARGFAHVGVIQVLEQAGIQPALVVGTSAGSLVAALYASGMNGAQLQRVAMTMEEASFTDWMLPLFGRGMLRGNGLARYVDQEVGGKTIEAMPLPLGIVATDLHSGDGVLFRRGDTGTAVRASSAVPAIFEPVRIAGHDYVDGGLVAPVPVDYARQMGAELVVAVDISSTPQGNPTDDTLQILLQTFTIMGRSIDRYELRDADLVVRPNLAGITSADFAARSRAIEAGRRAMQAALPKLKELIAAKSVPESGAAAPPDGR
ncbi:MAG: patatin-like phospholipase family protein [Proteobacteria bacterium]|nr:patatin-like phospholipase family protein [Pseudomonadota bacterium]